MPSIYNKTKQILGIFETLGEGDPEKLLVRKEWQIKLKQTVLSVTNLGHINNLRYSFPYVCHSNHFIHLRQDVMIIGTILQCVVVTIRRIL